MAAVALRFLGSARFRSPPYPAVLAVSPRGDFLVVAALREAWILRYETGELIGKIPLQSTSSLLLTFKAEGDRVLIGSLRSPALLCDLASATVVDTQPGLGMSAIALAADGRRALIAFDRVLTWWHLDRKERGPRLRRHRGMTHALALRAGDTEAVVVGENKVFLHDLERSLVVEIAHVHVSHTPITLSPDAATMAWAESGRIVLRATQPGAIERSAPVAWVHHLFFSSDSRYLLCTSMAGLTVLDVQSAGLVHHHPGWTPAVAASTPDGSSLVTIARSRVSGHVPPFARGIEIHQLDSSLPVGGVEGHEYAIQQLVFRPDGRTLLVTDESPTLRLWDRQTSAQRPHRWGGRPVIGIEISPDGRHALVRYSQGTSWFLWDLMADREIAELTSPVPYGTSQVSWSLDGRTVHGWHPHLIPQWSIPDGTLIATTVPPPLAHPPLYFVAHHQLGALTPDGPRLWTPGAPSGPLALKTGLPAWEHVFAVHPGGRTLATRSVHDRIHEWDTTTGALLRTVPDILTAFPCLAFSRDGSLLATSSIQEGQGPRVRVLDWPSGAALATLDLPWPGERVTALAFAPDDDSLLIGAAQGLIARVAASEFQQNLGTVI